MLMLCANCSNFLYTIKTGPAGGRLRRPSSAGEYSDPGPAVVRLYDTTVILVHAPHSETTLG
jgi:hypothetical protein